MVAAKSRDSRPRHAGGEPFDHSGDRLDGGGLQVPRPAKRRLGRRAEDAEQPESRARGGAQREAELGRSLLGQARAVRYSGQPGRRSDAQRPSLTRRGSPMPSGAATTPRRAARRSDCGAGHDRRPPRTEMVGAARGGRLLGYQRHVGPVCEHRSRRLDPRASRFRPVRNSSRWRRPTCSSHLSEAGTRRAFRLRTGGTVDVRALGS